MAHSERQIRVKMYGVLPTAKLPSNLLCRLRSAYSGK